MKWFNIFGIIFFAASAVLVVVNFIKRRGKDTATGEEYREMNRKILTFELLTVAYGMLYFIGKLEAD